MRLDEKGVVTAPLLILGTAFALAMLALLGLSLRWRYHVQTQRRLDGCVAETARHLREVQRSIESANRRLQIERAALATALAVNPTAAPPIRLTIQAEAAIQEARRMSWALTQAKWIARRGCDGKTDSFFPLPRLAWRRPPPDALGPRPLEWEPSVKKQLRIRLWRHPRYSAGTVVSESDDWRMRWSSPFAGNGS